MFDRRTLGVAALLVGLGCSNHQRPSPLDMDAQQLDALRAWPTVASLPAPSPSAGSEPPLPTLPPLIPGNNTRLVERLEVLVRGHPDADTRDALTTALDVGNVQVQLAPLGGRAAVFGNAVSASGSQAVLASTRGCCPRTSPPIRSSRCTCGCC